jgi:uncharacterized protein (DUF1330 family)
MAKGYWIAHVDISDAEAYKGYIAANAEAFDKFGARFLVRGGAFENPEGASRARSVVLEFPTYEAALACYRSPEYAKALDLRKATAVSDVIIIEGYDGPQPGGAASA